MVGVMIGFSLGRELWVGGLGERGRGGYELWRYEGWTYGEFMWFESTTKAKSNGIHGT